MLWLQELQFELGNWWADLLTQAGVGVTCFLIEGIQIIVVTYAFYCACRIMCCGGKDEVFSDYMNKSMIAGLGYFFAKCGGAFILHYMGV
ncbi:MAG: hypothetical protein RR817_08745 [Niameybacter sp.]